jgi:hypothetical protein
MRRVGLPTLATAVTASVITVAITYATAWRNNVWAWVAVGVLTLVSAGVSVWLYRQQQDSDTADISDTAESTVGRKVWAKRVRAIASGHATAKVGSGSHVDTVEAIAGLPARTRDPGTANSPKRRSSVDGEPAAMSDDDGQDVI